MPHFKEVDLSLDSKYMARAAKVRPSKDFLRPLWCQILNAQLSYFCNKKYPKLTSIMSYLKKNKPKKFLRPAIQYLNEIWPVSKKVWPPLVYDKCSRNKFKLSLYYGMYGAVGFKWWQTLNGRRSKIFWRQYISISSTREGQVRYVQVWIFSSH